jgi:hypothetical protein
MGDYSVIAAVTRTLVQVVQDGINRCEGDIARASVTTTRPDRGDPNPQPRVNLFMFHAVPNSALRNDDIPLRTPSGLIRRPMVPLDLFYLISFYGNDDPNRIEPQVLMGVTMSALNAHPILLPDAIIRAAASFDTPLDSQFALQQVQLTLHNMSVDELSRLWGTFPQVPYVPSVCYRASAVVIESNEIPAPTLPARGLVTTVAPALAPIVTAVRGAGDAPPVYGATLTVQGRNMAGDDVAVLLGGAVLRPASVTPTMLTVQPEGRGVTAGVQTLHVARDGVLSQATPLALAPAISTCTANVKPAERRGFTGAVIVVLQPPVQPNQGVVLELFPARTSLLDLRRSYRFESPAGDASSRSRTRLRIAVEGVAGGSYLVRVTVDGAASLMTEDARGRYNGPLVSIAAAAPAG